MPLRLGTSGSVRASSTREVGEVRPRGPHLLPGDDPRVAVALGARRERREVGARAGLAEQLAPLLLVAHDRREEAQPLLLGAVREQRGRGVVEAERVQPAEVERPRARARRAARDRGRQVEPAVLDRPRRRDEARTRRTPGTTPRSRRACAPRGPRPRRRRGPRRSTRAARWPRPTPAPRRRVGVARVASIASRGSPALTRPSKSGRPLLAERGQALAEVLACATTARARTPRCAAARSSDASRPACSSHFVRPSATVGPRASWLDELVDRAVELGRRHRAVDRAPLRRLGAR